MYFKRVLKIVFTFKKYFMLNILFSVLYAFFSAVAFLSLMPMLEVLFNGINKINEKPTLELSSNLGDFIENWLNYQVSSFAADDNQKAILFVVGIVVILFFLKNISNYFALFFSTLIRNGVIMNLKKSIYNKIIILPLKYFSKNKKGDLISRMTSDVSEVQNSFLSIIEIFIRDPLTIFFTLGAMFIISFKLTIFVILFIPLSGFIISFIGKSLKRKSLLVQKEQAELTSITEETINGIKIIKSFLAESFFKSKFDHTNIRFLNFSNKLINRQNIAAPLSEFLGILVIGVLLWYGGKLVLIEMELKPAAFITYMGLAYGVLTPAKSISKAFYSLKKGNAAAERVFEIIDMTSEYYNDLNKNKLKSFNECIEFKNVSFKYDKSSVLKNISLKINKGEMIAIVGASGSGKSTLVNLIPRFYDQISGKITIDGIDISNLSRLNIRSLIGIVSQESILFNSSIKENIVLGNSDSGSNDKLLNSLSIANANEFINEFQENINYNVGDNGSNLSGGQKQRIAIARAVYSSSPILILDEATSSLDSKSEKLVQNAIDKLMINKTSIVIAHRLSTIQNADKIIVLDKGEIIEEGSHNELIKNNSIYRKLISLQSFS
ncbi:MAG: ATP-binding cassette domain-containing protein [Cryomorphaceae bacterium]|nr:MAG: ATP-binding cassette domain-containing protein [Cryomorphaceae bacterium]